MVISGQEDHVGDLVVRDELQQRVALGAVAAHEGLSTVGTHWSVAAACAEAWEVAQAQRTADRSDLINRVGDGDELPSRAVVVRVKKGLLEPGELRGTQISAVRIVGTGPGVISSGVGGLQANVAVGAGIRVHEEGILAPRLGRIELLAAVRARIGRSGDRAAISNRLVAQESIPERLEADGAVHDVRGRGVHVIDVSDVATDVVAGIDAAACWHIRSGCTTDGTASRGTTVDVFAVAQLVVVPGSVVALCCVKHLKGVLATGVHRKEVLTILLLVVGLQLRLSREWRACRDERARNAIEVKRVIGERDRWGVQPCCAVVGTAGGEVAGVLVDHITEVDVEVEVLRRNHAGESIRADEAVVVTAEGEVQRSSGAGRGGCFERSDHAGFTRDWDDKAVVVLRAGSQAGDCNLGCVVLGGINRGVEGHWSSEGEVCRDLRRDIEGEGLIKACPKNRSAAVSVTRGDTREGERGDVDREGRALSAALAVCVAVGDRVRAGRGRGRIKDTARNARTGERAASRVCTRSCGEINRCAMALCGETGDRGGVERGLHRHHELAHDGRRAGRDTGGISIKLGLAVRSDAPSLHIQLLRGAVDGELRPAVGVGGSVETIQQVAGRQWVVGQADGIVTKRREARVDDVVEHQALLLCRAK